MPSRPNWNDEYWNKMDKETARKARTTCPKCGSNNTSYNAKFKVWRCNKCENTWAIKGVGSDVPWWKRMFGGKNKG